MATDKSPELGAIGGLLLELPVALFLMPCMYLLVARSSGGGSASAE